MKFWLNDKYYFKKRLKQQLKNGSIAIWNDPKYKITNLPIDYRNLYKFALKANKLQNYKNTNIVYQVLVYNYADGNNDGIGDFIGLTNKLDYIDNLGVDQIWLSPIHPSSNYHGYSVVNYCDVASQLGGMDAFLDFVNACHARGIKVYLDLVFNHTSYEHPWFQEVLYNNNEQFKDFYRLNVEFIDSDTKVDSAKHRSKYLNVDQAKTINQTSYLGRFWEGMPDLNLDNPAVIEQLIAIQQYWTAIGVDGFRYDAIQEFYSSELETKNNFNEAKIFNLLRQASNKITNEQNREEVFMFGEWLNSNSTKGLKYLSYKDTKGLDTIYEGYKLFRHNHNLAIDHLKLNDLVTKYQKYNASLMPFLDNHDSARWIDNFKQKALKFNKSKMLKPINNQIKQYQDQALFVLFALPGVPIIYYANELYFQGTWKYGDLSLREPLKWKDQNYLLIKDNCNDKQIVMQTHSYTNGDFEDCYNQSNAVNLIEFMSKLRTKYPFLALTNINTIADYELFIDTEFMDNCIARINPNNKNEILLFVFCDYRNNQTTFTKISRDYYFKPLLLNNAKNNSWNIEVNQGGYALYLIEPKDKVIE
ncbi:alpha-amylase [Mycoplasma sp. NEAQ87857]|uniref:alpha-amylase family glycosyl hydrolase n=1 Tax=Mycoplasma sp. NEAQ87857 TaxID=2683967 RepID=UPI001318FD1F|nr:alpha-amylase family glycosyl hydrolase [Mycoplasma sp. NEAQ87857]QGZ97223.1 alpha-amylase [Mycoplasma sp. NEAQ87857]